MKRKLLAFVLAISMVFALGLTGCSSSSDETEASSDDPLADGVLTIGVDDTYLPMEFRNEENELVGFDVDFAKALAEQLGVEIEYMPVAWDGIFNGLNAKQYDVIISSTSITPERQENFTMTDPYVANGIVIVSRTDAEPISEFSQLEGKTLGAQIETTADIAAEALKVQDGVNVNIQKFDAMLDAFAALQGQQIDNIITDIGVAMYYVSQDPDTFVVSSEVLTNEPIGITLRKEDTALAEQLNTAIAALQENGTMTEISNVWFGKDMATDIDTEVVVIE